MSGRRYPGYRASEVAWLGQVPDHWSVGRLKFSATYRSSSVDKKTEDDQIAVRLCNYTDVYYNERIQADGEFMEATATPEEVRRFRLWVDDVLITKDSEDWRDIAVPALIESTADDFVCGYHLGVIRPVQDRLHGPYLLRALQSSAVNHQFRIASSGVTRFGLPNSAAGNALIPLPPLDEQRAIATFLDGETARIDALIEKKQLLLERLEEQRTALISRVVTRGLPPDAARAAGLDLSPPLKRSGVEWLGDVPEHWTVGNIRRFAAMKTGHTPSRQHPEYWEDCDTPWFTLADVWQLRDSRVIYLGETKELVSAMGIANSAAELLPAGTVILSRTASIGFSGIMPKPMATSQDFWNWVCGPRLKPEYLLATLRAMRGEFDRLMMGSTHRTIYEAAAASFQIPVPPLDEQSAIVAFLDDALPRIYRLEDLTALVIERLREYRAALITSAVTGRIDVRESGREGTAAK